MLNQLAALEPHPGILAFCNGRMPGQRLGTGPRWADDGALSLGVMSSALLSGYQAIFGGTHVMTPHGRVICATLTAQLRTLRGG